MYQHLLLIIFANVLFSLAGCTKQDTVDETPEPVPITSGTVAFTRSMVDDAMIAPSALNGKEIQLSEGSYHAPEVRERVALLPHWATWCGDDCGPPLGAVIVVTNTGGSGNFRDLVVFEQDATIQQRASIALGDRVEIHQLSYESRTDSIHIDSISHGPGDPLCCPTQERVLHYRYIDGELTEWLDVECSED
jgi:hypothetical protein